MTPDVSKLVTDHLYLVRRYVRHYAPMLKRQADADGMESDAMLALVRKAQEYRDGIGSFETFAGPRVKGACVDALRTANGRQTAALVYEPAVEGEQEKVDLRDAAGRVVREVRCLEMQVLTLHHREGMTLNEVASRLGISMSWTAKMLNRAYDLIRRPKSRFKTNGRRVPLKRICIEPDCDQPFYARNRCELHYRKKLRRLAVAA